MNIVILGARGFLGTHLQEMYPHANTPSLDIADTQAVQKILDELKPDVLINAAGKTGRPNIDWCEDHKEETVHSNVTGPLVLLEECMKRNVYFVHFSSGCIFSGDNNGQGFSEQDAPNYDGSFYSRSKIWADAVLQEFPVLIIRPRMPFDASANERSLISKLKKYSRVLDEPNSMTYVPDMMHAINQLIEKRATGIVHMVNNGVISPYRIIELYKEIVDPTHTFERIDAEHLREVTKAGRSNCILGSERLQKEGIPMRPIEDAVREVLTQLASK